MATPLDTYALKKRAKLLSESLGTYPTYEKSKSVTAAGYISTLTYAPAIDSYTHPSLYDYTTTFDLENSLDGYSGNVRKGGYGKTWDKRGQTLQDAGDIIYNDIMNPSNSIIEAWDDEERNKYNSYDDYIRNIKGSSNSAINILGGIVTGKNTGISLGNNGVGVVSDFDIYDTIAGRIYGSVTGKETPLGKFGLKAAAVSMANTALSKVQTNIVNQGVNWLKGKITFWDKTDDITFDIADKSITVSAGGGGVLSAISEYVGLTNSATRYGDKSTIQVAGSIFDVDRVASQGGVRSFGVVAPTIKGDINPDLQRFLDQPVSKYGRVTYGTSINVEFRNDILLNNTGKMTVKFVYSALNRNMYKPNYTVNDDRIKDELKEKIDYADVMESDNQSTFNLNTTKEIRAWHQSRSDVKSNRIIAYNDNVYSGIGDIDPASLNKVSLLHKTKELFSAGKINTLTSAFHSTQTTNDDDKKETDIQTAVTKFGLSKGRNLLSKNAYDSSSKSYENIADTGYNDPYCRVWTWAKQYRKVANLIRPFGGYDMDGRDLNRVQLQNITNLNIRPGFGKLYDYSVLDYGPNQNGFLHIAPYSDDDQRDMKKYMFSIENLAWKDIDNNLCESQEGNLKGRIMWFPPYDLKFNEQHSTKWNSQDFIGRGEPVYTYVNTERSGTLSFKVLIDHPSILNYWRKKSEFKTAEDAEQEALRFFAGCDVLEGADIYSDKKKINNQKESENNVDANENKEKVVEPTYTTRDTVLLTVYFPNDYSGVGDDDAINYLINGVGTGVSDVGMCGYENGTGYSLSNVNQKNGTMTKVGTSTTDVYNFTFVTQKDNVKIRDNKYGYFDKNGVKINDGTAVGNMTRRDLLTYYDVKESDVPKGNVDFNTPSIARLPRERYKCDINYWDTTDTGLNASKGDGEYSFRDFYEKVLDPSTADGKSLISKIRSAEHIKFEGFSSSDGTQSDNNKLAVNRANTIKNWFGRFISEVQDDNIVNFNDSEKYEISKPTLQSTATGGDVSSDNAKKFRCVKVTITEKVVVVVKEEDANINGDINVNTPKVSLKDKIEELKTKIIPKNKEIYDDESRFFSRLGKDDEFIISKIREKVKYFIPAFHSTTPEGFNARLTFLAQCMRQGPTDGSPSENFTPANNLAFGRPPICVLRIGDFYNTKIIIDSLNIDYENLWDLNPEGIGVQPRIATVTLNFKFIGGSDLEGPISRLQNAVTFNFFANTGVYDDRSDGYKSEETIKAENETIKYAYEVGNNSDSTPTDIENAAKKIVDNSLNDWYNPAVYERYK